MPVSRLLLVAACALLDADNRILMAERPAGKSLAGLWEFPGGKIEPGEAPEAALVRELDEELAITVDPAALVPLTFASAGLGERHLLLLLYFVRRWQGVPQALEATALAWVEPAAMRSLAMPPADVPLVAMLERFLQIGG